MFECDAKIRPESGRDGAAVFLRAQGNECGRPFLDGLLLLALLPEDLRPAIVRIGALGIQFQRMRIILQRSVELARHPGNNRRARSMPPNAPGSLPGRPAGNPRGCPDAQSKGTLRTARHSKTRYRRPAFRHGSGAWRRARLSCAYREPADRPS